MYLNYKKENGEDVAIWLTLTWDVFKLESAIKGFKAPIRLTLTWDVFK